MRYRNPLAARVAAARTYAVDPHYRTPLNGHGRRAMTDQYIVYEPDTSNGRVVRSYGRTFIRELGVGCPACAEADRTDARLTRIRTAYGRRRR